ncbi:MAG: hypothetical protein ACR2NY_05395 [Alphaproteobacteria bacterium]
MKKQKPTRHDDKPNRYATQLDKKSIIALRDVEKKPIELSIAFSKTDKKQTAILKTIEQRLKLKALDELSANIKCEKYDGKIFYLSGRWSARVIQQCVISLENFTTTIAHDLSLDFIDEKFYDEKKHKMLEPIAGDAIDTLEQLVQELSLNLDPFPKKPGATIPDAFRAELSPANPSLQKPFAKLNKKLQNKK